jgi:hypothetical protein
MAMSDKEGNATMYLTSLDSGRHSLFQHDLPKRGNAVVETTTLDRFWESKERPRIDLIKIDVEGAEVAVLDGMTRMLEELPRLKIIIEFNPALLLSAGVAPNSFLDKVRSLGFQMSAIEDSICLSLVDEDDSSSLTDRLLAADNSVNLLCTRE